MDRDKLIAAALVVSLIFLFVAFVGVIGVTGLLLIVTNSDNADSSQNVPLIDAVGSASGGTSTAGSGGSSTGTGSTSGGSSVTPVCGDGEVEGSEQCEADSDCSSSQTCNTAACECEDVSTEPGNEPEPQPTGLAKLSNISVDSLVFWCAQDFQGKKGLAVTQIVLKNSGSSDFTFTGKVVVKAVTGETSDQITIASLKDFSIKAGKTERLYMNKALRTEKYLFLGNSAETIDITIEFGTTGYTDYSYKLRGQDFSDAFCQ